METGDNIDEQNENTMADLQPENEHFINNTQMKNTLSENYIQQQERLLKSLNEMHESNNTNISTTFQTYTKDNDKNNIYSNDLINNNENHTEKQNNNNNEQKNFVEMEVDETSITTVDSESQIINDNLSEPNKILEPSHHARRPMNAFLIFCKRHRAVVRERYPTLENRAVTKILGEWWAGLEEEDKVCYTALAKQYKDAFFSANPGFKWYKLPAPPLRTLNTRPGNYTRPNSSMEFDDIYENNSVSEHSYLSMSDFTPGKLADETQLGNLSSLIDPNYNSISNESMDIKPINRDQLNEYVAQNGSQLSPNTTNQNNEVIPPKPPRKKNGNDVLKIGNSSTVSRNIFDNDDQKSLPPYSQLPQNLPSNSPFINLRNHALTSTQTLEERKLKRLHKVKSSRHSSSHDKKNLTGNCVDKYQNFNHKLINGVQNSESMTQQELIDRIVEHSMRNDDCIKMEKVTKSLNNNNNSSDISKYNHNIRKSGRSCKGKRYAEFMTESRLVVNKHNKKNKIVFSSRPYLIKKSKQKSQEVEHSSYSYNVNLNYTIQKLSDRTKSLSEETVCATNDDESPRQRTHSGASDDSITKKMFRAADFNLDEKIEALPSLSLEKFQQKKKENKKRKKITPKSTYHKDTTHNNNLEDVLETNNNTSSLTGSRKRKARKESITHVVPTSPVNITPDLFNLATLAEVAVKLGGNPP